MNRSLKSFRDNGENLLNFLDQDPLSVFTLGACHLFAYALYKEAALGGLAEIKYLLTDNGPQFGNESPAAIIPTLHIFVRANGSDFDANGRFDPEAFLKHWRDKTGDSSLPLDRSIAEPEKLLRIHSDDTNKWNQYVEPQFVQRGLSKARDWLPVYINNLNLPAS